MECKDITYNNLVQAILETSSDIDLQKLQTELNINQIEWANAIRLAQCVKKNK